jgi:hypothetical protein
MVWLVQPCGRLFCAAACSSARVLDQIWGVGSMGHGVAYDSPSCGAAIRSMYAPCINIITLYLSIFNYIYIYSFLLIWPPKIACTDVDSFDENNRRMQGSFWSIFSQVTLGLAWLLERRQQKHMTYEDSSRRFEEELLKVRTKIWGMNQSLGILVAFGCMHPLILSYF